MTKAPEKPNVHQETGLMSLQDPDGAPWRTPGGGRGPPRPQVRLRLRRPRRRRHPVGLERQPLPADRQRGHDRLQPARRDGEARAGRRARDFAAFFAAGGALPRRLRARAGGPRRPVRAALLGPPGRDRPHEAARARCWPSATASSPQALPDIRLTADQLRGVKLAIVPDAARSWTRARRAALLEASKAGTKVLVTGPVEGDSYGRATPSLQALGVLGEGRPVALHEATGVGRRARADAVGHVREPRPALAAAGDEGLARRARRERLARAAAARLRPRDGAARRAPVGGAEGGRRPHAPGRGRRRGAGARRARRRCSSSASTRRRRRPAGGSIVEGRPVEIPVEAFRSRLVLFERGTGKVLAATPGDAIGRSAPLAERLSRRRPSRSLWLPCRSRYVLWPVGRIERLRQDVSWGLRLAACGTAVSVRRRRRRAG